MKTQNKQEETVNLPISFWQYQEIISKINNITFESSLQYPENEILGHKILDLIEEILRESKIEVKKEYG